jgi:rhodanese-related sulfurtransferase
MDTTPLLPPAVLRCRLETHPDGIRLLDVRTPAEFATAHIAGSDNVPVNRLAEQASAFTNSDAPIVLVCRSGQRAEHARAILQQAGALQLTVLDGGLEAWLADGHDVVRGRARMSLERQVRIAAGAMSGLGAVLALSVSPLFAVIPALVGGGLVFAGLSDTCAMASVLSRLPYNNPAACDAPAAGPVRGTADVPPGSAC